MPFRRRTRRSVRRRMMWATLQQTATLSGTTQFSTNLLASLESDLAANLFGMGVLRTVGRIVLQQAATASTPACETIALGITWISKQVATSAIPDPQWQGVNEARWIARGVVTGEEASSGLLLGRGATAFPPEANTWSFDTKNRSKQPTPDSFYGVVAKTVNGTLEADTLRLEFRIATLLQLP